MSGAANEAYPAPTVDDPGAQPAYAPCLTSGSRVVSNPSAGAIINATPNGAGDGVDFKPQSVLRWCLDEVDAQVWMRNPDWDRAMAFASANGGRGASNAEIPMLIPVQGKIDPREVTLHLACEVTPTGTQNESWADARLRIEWSSGITESGGADSPQTAIIDPCLGTVIQLSATRINVSLEYPTLPAGVGVSQPRLTIRASVGIGPRPAQGNGSAPRRTVRFSGVVDAGNSTAKADIPQWASSVVVANDTSAAPAMTVVQREGSNAAIVSAADAGKHDSESVPIRLGARVFSLTNIAAIGVSNVSAIFYLSL